MNILVVDDEKEIADVIALYLQSDQYTVYPFYTGEEALECMKTTKIDLAILDVMLPGIDGFEILKKIRERYTFPVIMLTAKTEYIDKITGLTLGADDYILKPFNPLELIARVKAQLRRYTQYNEGTRTDSGDIIDFAGLQLNRESHECVYNEKQLTLTPIEFDILYLLASNPGRVFGTDEIFERVWHEKFYEANNTVMVHIRRLRGKMKEDTRQNKIITTVWGVGYKIEK